MAVFKCKMCGGTLDVSEKQSIITCDYCGTRQTLPKLDDDRKLALFNRANRLRFNNEFDTAKAVYENIVADFPEEAEAYWGLVLCKFGIEYVDDPKTGGKVPTCHRTVTCSVLDDDNFKLAYEYGDTESRLVYREEAKAINQLQQKILAVVNSEEPYDIFICYKETDDLGNRTEDSVLAQDIYTELIKEGYKVFFARVTLRDKAGTDYEPYIYAALTSSKVMLSIGTKFEYFDAVWVKNEWSRYLSLMVEDNSKHLIPCYKDIDAYDMPSQFKNLQALNMGDVTFYKSLSENIKNIVSGGKKTNVRFSSIEDKKDSAENFVKLAKNVLENKIWREAKKNAEKALQIDAECAEAYMCLLLVENKIKSVEELNNDKNKKKYVFDSRENYKKYCKYYSGDDKVEIDDKRLIKKSKHNLACTSLFFIFFLNFILFLIFEVFYAIPGAINFGEFFACTMRTTLPVILAACILPMTFFILQLKKKRVRFSKLVPGCSLLLGVLGVLLIYKCQTTWSVDALIEKVSEFNEAGDYQAAVDEVFCYEDDLFYKDSPDLWNEYDCGSYVIERGWLFITVEKKNDIIEKINPIVIESSTNLAQEKLDNRDYNGFVKVMSNLPAELFGTVSRGISFNIPEEDYNVYETALSPLYERWASDYDYAVGEYHFYIHYHLLHLLPDGAVDTTVMDALYGYRGTRYSVSVEDFYLDNPDAGSVSNDSDFETLTFSGQGFSTINNINIPEGLFLIRYTATCSSRDNNKFYFDLYNENGRAVVYEIEHVYPDEPINTQQTFDGSINNGKLVIDAESNVSWTITIESIG